jgi:peptidoglycan/xylan/chitin deacetylase (PgdA/CDA1 family)
MTLSCVTRHFRVRRRARGQAASLRVRCARGLGMGGLLPLLLFAVSATQAQSNGSTPPCRGVVYLSFDTGTMRHADDIAAILRRHGVLATFFLANETTYRGDFALDRTWASYWQDRVAEGHSFGSHTWDHGRFLSDSKPSEVVQGAAEFVRYKPQFGQAKDQVVALDQAGICEEIGRVDVRFRELTGRALDPLWRAPAGKTTPYALAAAKSCGWKHVGWAPAGFLGDELPSGRYPNSMLLARALETIRSGDILMAHLGIRARQEPFAPMLDPLIQGLRRRGLCFATLASPAPVLGGVRRMSSMATGAAR